MQWSLVVFIVMGQWSSTGGQLCDYRFIGEKKTWKEAQKYCRTHHTDLATVSNQEDMKRLQDHAQYQSGAWIGLQRDWRWSLPGVEFKDSKWREGEPDNQLNKENCVSMYNDRWNDVPCDESYNFICYDERKTSGNTFYVIDYNKKTWPNAQSYCREHHTDLISGVQQLKDFKTQVQNQGGPFWIGLFRDPTWSWSDGSSFSFRLWDEHNQDPEKTCGMTTSGGFWSDDCSEPKTFFCYNAGTPELLFPPWFFGIITVAGFLFLVSIFFIVFMVLKARRKSTVETPGQEEEEEEEEEEEDVDTTKEEENTYDNLRMDGPEDKVTSM